MWARIGAVANVFLFTALYSFNEGYQWNVPYTTTSTTLKQLLYFNAKPALVPAGNAVLSWTVTYHIINNSDVYMDIPVIIEANINRLG